MDSLLYETGKAKGGFKQAEPIYNRHNTWFTLLYCDRIQEEHEEFYTVTFHDPAASSLPASVPLWDTTDWACASL